jgi:hypothetical protein
MTSIPGLPEVLDAFIGRGDLAHLALFLWALSDTFILVWVLRELIAANRRFDLFVREIADLNRRLSNL